MEPSPRKPYPTDVTDDEWVFVAPYLTLMRPSAPTSCTRCSTRYDGSRAREHNGGCCPPTSHDSGALGDYERLPETFASLHLVAFACLKLHRLLTVVAQSP